MEEFLRKAEQRIHPHVAHPVSVRERDASTSLVGKVNDWLATHLAVVFGVAWTIWVFFIVPIVAYFLPAGIQAHIFFFSSGWVQLFALPLMIYVGNKLQKSSDAQSGVMHEALTHIAAVEDQNARLLTQNTDLTREIHRLVGGQAPADALSCERRHSMSYAVLIDAIHADVANIPAGTPKVAGYVTGTADIQWVSSDWARFPESGHVRIDQSVALSAWASGAADVADVENGAATQASAVAAALEREKKGWWSFVYVAEGNLAAMQAAVTAAKLTRVQFWVANWNMNEEEAVAALTGDVVAIQWASPSSNADTQVPGGSQTLAGANVDLSVTVPSWFAYTPPATFSGLVVTPSLKTFPVTSADEMTWKAA